VKQQIEMALELLEPKQNAACRIHIELVLLVLAYFKNQDQLIAAPKSKAAKARAARLAAALRRVQRELKNDALYFRDQKISADEISDWIKSYDALAATPSGPPKRNADDKRRAVGSARSLLERYKQPIVTTKGSRFCRLAAVLYGTPHANFQPYCRESNKPAFKFASAKAGSDFKFASAKPGLK
jgi:hypothetical protein